MKVAVLRGEMVVVKVVVVMVMVVVIFAGENYEVVVARSHCRTRREKKLKKKVGLGFVTTLVWERKNRLLELIGGVK